MVSTEVTRMEPEFGYSEPRVITRAQTELEQERFLESLKA